MKPARLLMLAFMVLFIVGPFTSLAIYLARRFLNWWNGRK